MLRVYLNAAKMRAIATTSLTGTSINIDINSTVSSRKNHGVATIIYFRLLLIELVETRSIQKDSLPNNSATTL